jgi:hypothetical protein
MRAQTFPRSYPTAVVLIASPDFMRKIAQRLASLRRLQAAIGRLVGEFWMS